MQIVIGHLYSTLMNLYGDQGNVFTLAMRARWRSLDVIVTRINPDERPWWSQYDVVFLGGGQDREQRIVASLLSGDIGLELGRAVGDGLVLLAVCGGYQLLGHYYRLHSGQELRGAGLFDCWTESGKSRMVGDVLASSEGRELVGFENHAGRTFLGQDAVPLARIVRGFGNNGKDGTEGIVRDNAVGTYLHGPILPKNPWLADDLILRGLQRRYGRVELPELDDEVERAAAATATARAKMRRVKPNMI